MKLSQFIEQFANSVCFRKAQVVGSSPTRGSKTPEKASVPSAGRRVACAEFGGARYRFGTRWAFLLAVALVGCAAPTEEPPARWHADVRFTAEERAAIVEGADWLSKNSGHDVGGIEFDYRPEDKTIAHTIRRDRGPHGSGECFEGSVYLGLDEPGVRDIDVEGLAAHELAHCELGFVDDPQSAGLMHVITPMRWTEREAAQLVRSRP